MSVGHHAVAVPRESSQSMRRAVRIAAGATIGLLLGFVIDAAAWLYAFGSALNGSSSISIPFIVTTYSSGDNVTARSGIGVLLLPLALAVVGAALGLIASRSRANSQK